MSAQPCVMGRKKHGYIKSRLGETHSNDFLR